MRSYPLLIDGQVRDGQGWNYVVRASALIADPMGAFGLKRALELGERDPGEAPEEVIGRCAFGDRRDSAEALEAAARAFPEYSRTPMSTRREIAADFGQAVCERAEDLIEILIAEGHPRRVAEWELRGVIDGTCPETMDWYFSQLRQHIDQGKRQLILQRKPDGVVCLNPPQNAAGSNSALAVGALLSGNTLVVKAPRSTPLSVMFLYHEIVAPILDAHGAPPGTLNIISGDTKEILRQWTESPLVNDVMFFGDSAVGLKVGKDLVTNGKKAILELSGNDGIVIWDDADLDAAAVAMCECFYGSSQVCMVPKYAVAHPAIADELIERVLGRMEDIRPGMPEDPDVVLSPVLKADRYFDCLAEARQGGVDILCGGERVDVEGNRSTEGFFLEPTLLRVDGMTEARTLTCVREETFFPLLPVIVPAPDEVEGLLDRVIAFLNANEYGLRNSLWAKDPAVVDRFVTEVSNAGLLKVNESHIAFAPVLATHGGTGRTGGPYGEMNYPPLRTSHLQGAAVVPAGTYSEQDLIDAIGLPQRTVG
ncbi:MAG: aldehyde dehydrogenase [Actinobacteria bacterium]|nr:MAG: aldehyde dehydrogenase [Actinomycetota bacterium]